MLKYAQPQRSCFWDNWIFHVLLQNAAKFVFFEKKGFMYPQVDSDVLKSTGLL